MKRFVLLEMAQGLADAVSVIMMLNGISVMMILVFYFMLKRIISNCIYMAFSLVLVGLMPTVVSWWLLSKPKVIDPEILTTTMFLPTIGIACITLINLYRRYKARSRG